MSGKIKKVVLLQDIVIPKGAIFIDCEGQRTSHGKGSFSYVLGLTNDTSGELVYGVDLEQDGKMEDWFAPV